MNTFLTSARPKNAAIAWATKDSLFVEIPCKNGPPYICRYHRTLEGLAQALNVIVKNPEREARSLQRTHPNLKIGSRPQPKFTDEQREAARAVLRKLGLT